MLSRDTSLPAAAILITSILLPLLMPRAAAAAPNIRLTTDAASSVRPRAALDPNGNVVVVWQDGRFGNDEILWQKFDRVGNPLTAVVRVTNTAGASRYPDVSCDPSGVSHIAWQEGENINSVGTVYFCRLNTAGTKVLNDVQVAANYYGHPQVSALADGSTDLTYFRSSGILDFYTLYCRYSAAGALACGPKQLGGSFTATVLSPSIATTSAGVPYVFWLEIPTSSYEVRVGTISSCGSPSITPIAGATSITTTTSTFSGSYVFEMFDAGGNIQNVLGAGNVCKISQGSGQATAPSVAADANDGYVVWRDTRDGGNGEIYFARFWGCTNRSGDIRLTNDPAVSAEPDIAVDPSGSGYWVAVWRDARDGNNEIYMTYGGLPQAPVVVAPATETVQEGLPLAFTVTASDPDGDAITSLTAAGTAIDSGASFTAAVGNASGTFTWTPSYGQAGSYSASFTATNGLSGSTTTGITVAASQVSITGVVRATVVDLQASLLAFVTPLPNVQVALLRNGVVVGGVVAQTDQAGAYDLPPATLERGDQIAAYLQNARMKVSDFDVTDISGCGASAPSMITEPIQGRLAVDLTFPDTPDNFSGDAVNLAYWSEHILHDYWQTRLLVPDTPTWRMAEEFANTYQSTSKGTHLFDGPYTVRCSGSQSVLMKFPPKFSRYRSCIAHELGHRMIIEKVGAGLEEAPSASPQTQGMDEGLADYFAASDQDDPRIYPYNDGTNVILNWSLRDLSQLKQQIICNGVYQGPDRYYDGRVFGGALWDWRKKLVQDHGLNGDVADRAVYEVVGQVGAMVGSARTFLAFRDALRNTTLGNLFPQDLGDAFSRHNISDSPHEYCKGKPTVKQVVASTTPTGTAWNIAWAGVEEANGYRVYARPAWTGPTGFCYGFVVADSVADTNFVYVEPDTGLSLSFIVTSRDSLGFDDRASSEVPPPAASVGDEPSGSLMTRLNLAVYPNPTDRGATVEFSAARGGSLVTVRIYDVQGRRVREYAVRGEGGSQRIRVSWDGRSTRGVQLPSGVYFVHVGVGPLRETRKVILTR